MTANNCSKLTKLWEISNIFQKYLYNIQSFKKAGNLVQQIKERIKNNQEFEIALIWRWISEIIKGLDFLHSNRIIHRDIKPEY